MNTKRITLRVGALLSVAVAAAVGWVGCGGEDKPVTPPAYYTLTTTADPTVGGNIIRSLEESHYEAGTKVTLTAEANTGYTFIGWDGAMSSKATSITVTMNSDLSITAKFQQGEGGDDPTLPQSKYYTLTTTADPTVGGQIMLAPYFDRYEAGTKVTLTALPDAGYIFTEWDGAVSSNDISITVTMDSDLTLIAKFELGSTGGGDDPTPSTMYTLTTTADPTAGGSVQRSLNQSHYEAGTKVTLTAVAKTGYTFIGWEGAMSSNDESITVTMNSNLTLIAKFEQGSTGGGDDPTPLKTYTLTTSASPIAGGDVTRNPDLSRYEAGMKVTLTAVANPGEGYVFAGWTGASSSMDPSITITMDGDKTLIANFSSAQPPRPHVLHTLTVNRNPANGGTVTPATPQSDIDHGTAVNISATVASGYSFVGWTVTSGMATIADANALATTVTMSSNVTVTANFQLQIPPSTYTGGSKKIGSLTWMTENLNVETLDSWCYENSPDSCAKYGRLYTWEAAKSACASLVGGWRLPTREDRDNLVDYAGGWEVAGKKLKAKSGWIDSWNGSGNGTDDYGFSALPGGQYFFDGSIYNKDGSFFDNVGNGGYWWSANAYVIEGVVYATPWRMIAAYDSIDGSGEIDSRYGLSARCVED